MADVEGSAAAAPAVAPAATEEDITVKNPDVVTKYKTAAEVANRVLKHVVEKSVEGAAVLSICAAGDKAIEEGVAGVFRKGKDGQKVDKGVAFPTCLSINNCACHFSPLASDPEVLLKKGDLVKVELGVHIDGFAAVVAHTFVVGATAESPATGRQADVIQAAYLAGELAVRLIRPGKKSTDVIDVVNKVFDAYKVKYLEGVSIYINKKNVIDGGDKVFTINPSDSQKKESKAIEFAENEAYNVDIIVSSGDGKTKQVESRTTVFRRTDVTYMLKMKTSRAVYSEIANKFGAFAFPLRMLEDEKKGRMGIIECVKHGVVQPYDVLYEKEGEFVAQYKYTVLLTSSGSDKITSPLFDQALVKSEHTFVDAELRTLLAQPIKKKAANKKKKKTDGKKGEAGAAGSADGSADGKADEEDGDEA